MRDGRHRNLQTKIPLASVVVLASCAIWASTDFGFFAVPVAVAFAAGILTQLSMFACVSLGAAFVVAVALTVEPSPNSVGPSELFIPSALVVVAIPMAVAAWLATKHRDQMTLPNASRLSQPMDGTRTRGRLSFNTRTMLIAVTIFTVWLGWQANRVWDRRTMAARIRKQGGFIAKHDEVVPGPMLKMFRPRVEGHSREIPWLRRQFGDFRVRYVLLTSKSWTDEEVVRISKVFPEADIVDY